MTLCIAWIKEREIFLVSDSRLSNNGGIVTDEASKIFKIDVKIFGPNPEGRTVQTPLIHQTTFGMCFCGSYLNGSTIADTFEEVLSNIQASAQVSDFSLEALIKIAFSIYKQVSTQLIAIHRNFGISTVLIGGYCPVTAEFGLYEFKAEQPAGEIQLNFAMNPIDFEKANPYYIGDSRAIDAAQALSGNIDDTFTHFHIIRTIIQDGQYNTVGGNIQAAKFYPHTFETYGIAQYSIEQEPMGPQIKDTYTFRGFSLDLEEESIIEANLLVKKKMFNPFQHERDEMFRDIMQNHWGEQ
ncbi:hypothetical protein [Flavobacterium collinsii]|uniref:Uncharacterized protein n=1 Tax=Flavobacterium collinsii TaxID=1114861 RepID=A0A9W4TJ22_9FLAO|nr:hypothetical protein [Flavobacterium collinsii]CAI2768166.1 conserved protein of unknown function [Flavobacterium collinsii]